MGDDFQKHAQETIQELRRLEWERTSSDESKRQYLIDHEYRFEKTLSFCKQFVPDVQAKVLDIGRSYFTTLLAGEYQTVWTLGLDPIIDKGGHRSPFSDERKFPHITFDLNNARSLESWPRITERFDLIVFAETIEHLTIAPEYPLLFLASLLNSNGILLLTTPNAVTFSKRLKFLCGRNPFEQIRLLSENPGHYREYTLAEMRDIGRRCNLKVVYQHRFNFYNHHSVL